MRTKQPPRSPVALTLTTQLACCRFGAAAVLGNSDPLGMWRISVKKFGIKGGEHTASSYPAHLGPKEHARATNITDDYQILLFHFVTRAQNNFVDRKIKLQSGVYATTYAEIAANATADTDTDELYKRFENSYGFDGEHDICKQGGKLHSAMMAAREAGTWHPIPITPGLIPVNTAANTGGDEEDESDEEDEDDSDEV